MRSNITWLIRWLPGEFDGNIAIGAAVWFLEVPWDFVLFAWAFCVGRLDLQGRRPSGNAGNGGGVLRLVAQAACVVRLNLQAS